MRGKRLRASWITKWFLGGVVHTRGRLFIGLRVGWSQTKISAFDAMQDPSRSCDEMTNPKNGRVNGELNLRFVRQQGSARPEMDTFLNALTLCTI